MEPIARSGQNELFLHSVNISMPDDVDFWYINNRPAGAAINRTLHPVRWRMWEMVALGLFFDPPDEEGLEGVRPGSAGEIQPWVLSALTSQLEELEPAWQLTARTTVVLRGSLEVAAASCGLPLEIVAASTNNGASCF